MAMAYHTTLLGWLLLGLLLVVQFIVADVAGIRAKHVPGMPITSGHGDFLFRATRAVGNTNEVLPMFLLLSLGCVLAGASPSWTGGCVWLFVVARVAYMACYLQDWRTPRSTMFAVGQLGQLGLLVTFGLAVL